MLYPGSGDKAVRAWSAVSGELLRTYEGHGGPVCCLQVVVDVLNSGSGDNTVRSVRFVRPSLAPQLRAAPSAALVAQLARHAPSPGALDAAECEALCELAAAPPRTSGADAAVAAACRALCDLVAPAAPLRLGGCALLGERAPRLPPPLAAPRLQSRLCVGSSSRFHLLDSEHR